MSFDNLNTAEQRTCVVSFFWLGGRRFCEGLFPYLQVCVAYDLVKGLDILGILNLAVLSISAEYAHNFQTAVESFQVILGVNLLVTQIHIEVVNHEWSVLNGSPAYPPPAPPPGGGQLLDGNFEQFLNAHLYGTYVATNSAGVANNYVPPTSWAYQPSLMVGYTSLSAWTFSSSAGVSVSNQPWGSPGNGAH